MAKILASNVAMTVNQVVEAVVKYIVDYAVYIGRFQPLHAGHEAVIRNAFEKARVVIAVVGSAGAAPDIRNPLTYAIRRKMLISAFRKEFREGRLIIVPVADHTYENGAWHREVLDKVNAIIANDNNPSVALLGFKKDETSSYLDWFPDWASMVVEEQFGVLNATDIRAPFFESGHIECQALSEGVVRILKRFKRTKTYRLMIREQNKVRMDNAKYGGGPFRTSDMLIEYGDEVLVIVRGGDYGHGLIALPGGINDGEDPIDCAIRELAEEVGIFRLNPWLTEEMLRSWIVNHEEFAAPGRDARGCYITTAVHIRIPTTVARPVVKGDDDAKAAHFIKREAFKRKKAFADHFHVVRRMLADSANKHVDNEMKIAA